MSKIKLINNIDYNIDGIYDLPEVIRHKIWFHLGKWENYDYMFILTDNQEKPYYIKIKKFWNDYHKYHKIISAIYDLNKSIEQLYSKGSFMFPKDPYDIIKEKNNKNIIEESNKVIQLFK